MSESFSSRAAIPESDWEDNVVSSCGDGEKLRAARKGSKLPILPPKWIPILQCLHHQEIQRARGLPLSVTEVCTGTG